MELILDIRRDRTWILLGPYLGYSKVPDPRDIPWVFLGTDSAISWILLRPDPHTLGISRDR